MENTSRLTELGLSEQEAEAYLALLQLGGSVASDVAKQMGVKRTTVYPLLHSMANKGFITVYFKKNKRFYYAQKPHKLSKIFEKKLSAFNDIIPLLEALDKKQIQSLGLRFVETTTELKQFYDDVLTEYKNKEYYAIGNTNAWENVSKDFVAEYRKERARLKIRTKLLLTSDSAVINPLDKSLLREFKYLPPKYQFKSTMDIFDDKVIIISPELTSLAVVISVPAMIDIFRGIFNIIWDFIE